MSSENPPTRETVTQRILYNKALNEKKWEDLAQKLNRSVEWTVAACLGQMPMSKEQAEIVCQFFYLNEDCCRLLQQIPYRNPHGQVPTDPLLYRLHEVIVDL